MTQTVGVVGAGTMGAGIAQVCVAAGMQVRLFDADVGALEAGRSRVVAGLDRFLAKGRLNDEAHAGAISALVLVDELAAVVEGASVVIEAASEDRSIKQRIFETLDGAAAADVILATNTSSLSVEVCASATRRPERVIGMHFFNPAPLMALVEVAATERTSQVTVEQTLVLAAAMGKTAVRCADSPGFIVNRVGRPYLTEAVRMLAAGQGSVEGIDGALEAAGYPMGPFRLIDLIGLDVDVAIDESLRDAFGDAVRFEPPAIELALIDAGRLGRKAGHGFYRYPPTRSDPSGQSTEPDVAGRSTAEGSVLTADAMVERVELAMINEAYRAVEEGVASPPDVDTAMRLGAGHPWGPFERVDALGLRTIVERLHELHAATAGGSREQYEVAPLLWTVATV